MSALLENLIKKTVSEITESFESKISEVLSSCDSPIEKVFLIMLLNKALTLDSDQFEFGAEDHRPWGLTLLDSEKITKIIREKFDFPHDAYGAWRYRYSSFRITLPFMLESSEEKERTQIEKALVITPQFMLFDEGAVHFIDIGVTLESKYDAEPIIVADKKIAIECDGHAYHSSKEQITRDNIRARKLTKAGWSVLRFSGSEIYADSQKELKGLVDEVFKILDIDIPF
jgi:hypothetical protein